MALRLISRARDHGQRMAVRDPEGIYTYAELLEASGRIARSLLQGATDLQEARIAFLVPPGFRYVSVQWGIWRAGGITVPLCVKHPLPAIRYVLQDAQVKQVIFTEEFEDVLAPLRQETDLQLCRLSELSIYHGNLPEVAIDRRAMILYTSGTTGSPKGVVTTHATIESQITTLVDAWEWQTNDHILNVLPLHHVHGIINVVSCALWSGACCSFLDKFRPGAVFELFQKRDINVFMAVPTIYFQLISYWESKPPGEQQKIAARLRKFRLMVSGSAALPVSVLEKWRQMSGHTLLERYGMTEIGMALSNPYQGERRPGHVGLPLPGVKIRLVDEQGEQVAAGTPGEIQVKGANVFTEYWNKPQATAAAFTTDGWFKTGDIAVQAEESYRILGRNSIDIIKSGGYKISALEIEEVLRTHPLIQDCAVVGVPDEEWGEIVAAGLVPTSAALQEVELIAWLKDRLPAYQLPRRYLFQQALPRNTIGKVTKKALVAAFVNQSNP